ncbi:hypothetical protein [Streptomyces sp. NPDC047097]|uniref:hypothetical protein n=1 Tax=Streptomyces sp. NPDC047097 TaxID=3155260 RepID=UPI0033D86249
MGLSPGPAARLPRGVPADDRRRRGGGGRRGFTEGEDIRAAVGAPLTATGVGGAGGPPGGWPGCHRSPVTGWTSAGGGTGGRTAFSPQA